MSDKFPEAFARFEKVVDVSECKEFKELLASFSEWAGYKFIPTDKQLRALRDEARKRNIPMVAIENKFPFWRFETVRVRGKGQVRYRDLKSGRFIKKP